MQQHQTRSHVQVKTTTFKGISVTNVSLNLSL